MAVDQVKDKFAAVNSEPSARKADRF